MDRSTAVTSHAQHVRPPRRGRVGRVSGVLAVIAAASIGATQAQATTYCVNATSCVGTAQPTLDAAITTAKAAGGTNTIRLGASGTPYSIPTAANRDVTNVNLVGDSRDSTTIDLGTQWLIVRGVTVSGMTITSNDATSTPVLTVDGRSQRKHASERPRHQLELGGPGRADGRPSGRRNDQRRGVVLT